MFFGFEILIGVFVGVLFATIVVLIMHIRTTSQVNKMTFPAYEYAMKKAEHDAQTLISDARKNARKIIIDAEKAGLDAIAGYTNQATEIHEQYRDAVAQQTQAITDTLQGVGEAQAQVVTALTSSAEEFIKGQQEQVVASVTRANESLTQTVSQAEQGAQEAIESLHARVEQVASELETKLREVDAAGQQKLAEHLALLHSSADSHIATYKTSREELLNAHIEQLVESVVVKVLHTKLPVSEHASLARAALEEAKSKHIL